LAETLGAEAAEKAAVPWVAVLPHPNPGSVWPPASRERYRRLVPRAQETLTLSKKSPRTRQEARMATAAVNTTPVAAADGALVVWNGVDNDLGATVAMVERQGPDEIWVIRPT
jgi:hypothetical protein